MPAGLISIFIQQYEATQLSTMKVMPAQAEIELPGGAR